MSTFLTDAELCELTDAVHKSKQIEWLAVRGWPFEQSCLGKIKVLRSTMEAKMGVVSMTSRRKSAPDANALREMMNGSKKTA